MSMLTTYPGMSDDPVQDSRVINREELIPIMERLKAALAELEERVQLRPADYDDDGHHGD